MRLFRLSDNPANLQLVVGSARKWIEKPRKGFKIPRRQ